MAYDLHIERTSPREAISLAEWQIAVRESEDLRINGEDVTVRNPRTLETITLPGSDGDAEIRFPSGEWAKALRWHKGSVTFRADLLDGEDGAALAKVVFAIAERLRALVVGDDGEIYSAAQFGVTTTSERNRPNSDVSSQNANVVAGPWKRG